MSFKENLLKKINIDGLAEGVRKTIGPAEGSLRLDKEIMAQLLELGGYLSFKERDLTLYTLEGDMDHGRFLVLGTRATAGLPATEEASGMNPVGSHHTVTVPRKHHRPAHAVRNHPHTNRRPRHQVCNWTRGSQYANGSRLPR